MSTHYSYNEETRKSCNRHNDCDLAETKWRNTHTDRYLPIYFHCYDDECEECFGY
jgi:hypothetical protein